MATTMTDVFSGQCLCGGVRYEIVDFVTHSIANCHCSMCRKFHGAAFATYGSVKREHFTWVAGEELLTSYQAPNGTVRRFCSQCGSSLTFAPLKHDGSMVEIALGTLNTPIPYRANAHIYCAYKANWHAITDGVSQYPEGRGSE